MGSSGKTTARRGYKANERPKRAYALVARVPRTFFGGAAFFSFWVAMMAETRAMAAYRENHVLATDTGHRNGRENMTKMNISYKNVSPKESGEREEHRTVPDSDMGRVRRDLIGPFRTM